jgi:tetratricopeptide (TPR) repeat protein
MNSPGTLGAWEDRPRRNPDADLAGVPLDSKAVFLLTRIDGATTIADLCAMSGMDDAEAVKVLSRLREAGLIVVEKAPPVRAPTRDVPRVEAQPSAPPRAPAPSVHTMAASLPREPEAAPTTGGPRREDLALLRRYGRFGHVPAEIFRKPGEARFGNFQFDRRELLEQCDLSLEQKKELLFLHHNGEKLDLFEYFDIEPTDDRKLLRKAYFAFSKKFHPDAFFRKNTGSFGEKLHAIFKFGNDVNDKFQSDDALREAYFRVVQARNDVYRQGLERARAAVEAERDARLRDEAEGRKAELQQKLAERKQARRDRPETNPMTARIDKAAEYYQEGMKLYQDEKFVNAANSLQLAVTFDPKNDSYRTAFERVNEKAKQVRAEQLWKQGFMHEQLGQTREALQQFKQALEFWRRHDYLFHTAEVMLDLNEDLNAAAELARLATEAAPQKVDYLALLGKIYETVNLSKRAQAVYERALKLDPQNETIKKSLKALKRI